MSEQIFRTILARSGDSGSRHRSLVTSGAAGLAAAGNGRAATAAMKNGRNARKKGRKKAAQTCQSQVVDCQEFVIIGCSGREDAEACKHQALPCCDSLATCDATSMLDCIFVF